MRAPLPFMAAMVMILVCRQAAATGALSFTVDPTLSSVSVSGYFTVPPAGDYGFQPQGVASLTTSFGGSAVVEVVDAGILFPGGSDIYMTTNGTWEPTPGGADGEAPANYAGMIHPPFTTNHFAVRNLRFDLTGAATPDAGGAFDAILLVAYLTNANPRQAWISVPSPPLRGTAQMGPSCSPGSPPTTRQDRRSPTPRGR